MCAGGTHSQYEEFGSVTPRLLSRGCVGGVGMQSRCAKDSTRSVRPEEHWHKRSSPTGVDRRGGEDGPL